jgi:lipopolysaccharide export system permease protein
MLNLKQLEMSTDSLRNEMKARVENYNIASYLDYSFLEKVDTIRPPDSLLKASDRLFLLNRLDKPEKVRVIDEALRDARSTKENAEYQKLDFTERLELIRKHQVEWYLKFTLSFACLVLFFVGAPLGAIIRRGGLGLPLVISVIFFVIYHVLSMIGKKAVIAGSMDPAVGMWLSSIVLLPLGIILTYKATNDSPLFDVDVWKRKLLGLFKK